MIGMVFLKDLSLANLILKEYQMEKRLVEVIWMVFLKDLSLAEKILMEKCLVILMEMSSFLADVYDVIFAIGLLLCLFHEAIFAQSS